MSITLDHAADADIRRNKIAPFDRLLRRIETRQARIGIIGLGYVGLPLVGAIASAGYRVIGCDVDAFKVSELQAGRSYIRHIASEHIADLVKEKLFTATCESCLPSPRRFSTMI